MPIVALLAIGVGTFLLFWKIETYKARKFSAVFSDNQVRRPVFPASDFSGAGEKNDLVILFGDSRIDGWAPLPDIPGKTVLKYGVPGGTSRQLMANYEQDVLSIQPEMIILQIGINDLVAASLHPEHEDHILSELKKAIDSFVSKAAEQNTTVVLLTVIRPSSPSILRRLVWSDRIFQLVQDVNAHIRSLEGGANTVVLDADALLSQNDRRLPSNYAKDTLHFKQSAYEKLNAMLVEAGSGAQ